MIGRRAFREGDFVVYRKTKHAPKPGPRAKAVVPTLNGDDYVYNVDKFWIVDRVTETGALKLRTRRGKIHMARPDDPNLRHAGLLVRLLNPGRFPSADHRAEAELTGEASGCPSAS